MAALNGIHRDFTNSAVVSYRMDVVLGGSPPPIVEEENLPRKTRVVPAIRSEWSNKLNSYLCRTDCTVPNLYFATIRRHPKGIICTMFHFIKQDLLFYYHFPIAFLPRR